MRNDLTVCSVSFNSASYLRLNHELTDRLNVGRAVRWIIAENSPLDSPKRLGLREPGMQVIEGAGNGHAPTYHHTLALSKCIERADTRYVVTLDPDFFVVQPDWVDRVIAHMASCNLAIFGVPWHPRSRGKYRYFPAVHFSVFDTKLFPRSEIDFRPDFPDGDADPGWPNGWDREHEYFVRSRLAGALARLPFLRHRRHFYTDTGSRLFKKYVDDRSVRYETIAPVYDLRKDRAGLSAVGRVLESVLPDELCYFPKHYSNHECTRASGSRDTNELLAHWEVFAWGGGIFGFHVRGNLDRARRSAEEEFELAKRATERLCWGDRQ